MRSTIDHRKCDQCGKVVEQAELQLGVNPFNGWFKVQRIDGSTDFLVSENHDWDFCQVNCAIAFLVKSQNKVKT